MSATSMAERRAMQRGPRPLANAPMRTADVSRTRLALLGRLSDATVTGAPHLAGVWVGALDAGELRAADWLLMRGLVVWKSAILKITPRGLAIVKRGETP